MKCQTLKGSAIILTAVANCANGPTDAMRVAVGEDPVAFHHSMRTRKSAIKGLKADSSSKKGEAVDLIFGLGLNSLKVLD